MARDWEKITIRTFSKGNLNAYFHRLPVWLLDETSLQKYKLILLIRKDLNGDVSCHLTNSTAHLQRLAYMQDQRYFLERAFQDAKQELGMDQYQVRGYAAWQKFFSCSRASFSVTINTGLSNVFFAKASLSN